MKITDFSLDGIDGTVLAPELLEERVVLVVNVASRCGLTPQYEGLEALQRRYREQGFTVLGLPCNQFAGQEPGNEAEILDFCQTRYDVSFPLTRKIEVNGPGRHPLYAWLAGERAQFPGDITWNFEKFLVGRDGGVKARFAPKTPPDDAAVLRSIESLL
jgi:glutathione peroxidase